MSATAPLGLFQPAIFIRNFAGLANRIEALNIAFALAAAGGHEIVLDWPELDVLFIEGTRQGALRWPRRLLRHKPGRFDRDEQLLACAAHHTIDLRRFYGDAPLLDAAYPALGSKLQLASRLASRIETSFAQHAGHHPVVGVHIRRGDFKGADSQVYSPQAHSHAAVPMWWYVAMMDGIRALQPDVRFFLALNGALGDFPELASREDVFVLDCPASFDAAHPGHASATHPVADLFALACCSLMLATPGSSFSHVAANVLGPPTAALLPAAGARPDQPDFNIVRARHRRLAVWNEATRGAPIEEQTHSLPLASSAQTGWLFANGQP